MLYSQMMLHILLFWTLLMYLFMGGRYWLSSRSSFDFSDDCMKLYLLSRSSMLFFVKMT